MSQESSLAGLRRIPVPGCGDCQFDAIIYSAELPMTAAALRAEIVNYLRPQGDRFRARLEERFNGRWPSYCEHMSRPRSWGDELTLLGARSCFAVTYPHHHRFKLGRPRRI